MSRVTRAERQALEAIVIHGTVKAAAYALGKSPRTVDQQLASARKRLGVDSTLQAVVREGIASA
jgi:DNA-binding CsgD family transcriptional regulator